MLAGGDTGDADKLAKYISKIVEARGTIEAHKLVAGFIEDQVYNIGREFKIHFQTDTT